MANPVLPKGIGFKPVAAPGTLVALAGVPTPCKAFRILPLKTTGAANTGVVYIGAAGMVRATGVGVFAAFRPTDQGITINIGDMANADLFDLANWFVDADTAADAVLVGFLQ